MILVLLTSSACFFASMDLRAAPSNPSSTGSSTAEQAAREELVRRQEAQLAAERLLTQGEKLFYAGKYSEAVAKLEQGIRLLPRAPATEVDYNRALHGLTDSYTRLADAALHSGDIAKAREFAGKALEYVPENGSAKDILTKAKHAESEITPTNPTGSPLDQTPEFVAKKDQIKKLFREGKILMNSGQYDEAESRFQQILILDPYNADANALLKALNKQRVDYAQGAQDETRVHRLWEVSDRWTPPISSEVQPPKTEEHVGPIVRDALRQESIIKKLNEIVIPEINFREAAVSDAITFLGDESRRLDPEKVGVNIVLSSGIAGASPKTGPAPAAAPTAPTAPGAEATAPATTAAEAPESSGQRITLKLRNVPLIEALKYVTEGLGLKYRIESSAVIILPLDAAPGEMVTRSYPVTPGVFKAPNTGVGTGVGTANATPTGAVGSYRAIGENQTVAAVVASNEVENTFRSAGVPFPPGSSLAYNSRTSTIIIRNTPENLEIFERVLSAYNFIPSQIEIEAKFVQISQNDLDELGFDWQMGTKTLGSFDVTGGSGAEAFPPGSGASSTASYDITSGLQGVSAIQGNAIASLLAAGGLPTAVGTGSSSPQTAIGTIRGILTNPQFQVVINALAQKQSADTLSAPKVTTVSGQQAQIRSVQEFIYPTSWAQPTATSSGGGVTGGGAVAVTPSIPSSFQTREVGVLLNVTPEVGADGYTINLTLAPEVSEFLGFINYGSPIGLSSGAGNVVTTMNNIEEPLFSSENLTTSVVIWDGQTVVLGGLITEQLTKIDDKVPFLGDLPLVGRLFQSKVTQRSKLNLLVFVTARLIDPAGNPVHRLPVATSARY
jgi:general secretion pathway protein D